jgi:hypothetical protein
VLGVVRTEFEQEKEREVVVGKELVVRVSFFFFFFFFCVHIWRHRVVFLNGTNLV